MQLIISDPIHSNPIDRWNVDVYDYKLVSGTSQLPMDFQTLLTKVNVQRAVSIEGEVSALATKMRKRNTKLDQLGGLIADLGKAAAQFKSDKGNESVGVDGWSDKALEGLKQLADSWYFNVNAAGVKTSVHVQIGTYQGNWTIGSKDSILKSTYEMVNQLAKTKIDGLNNESQLDMTTLQSYVNKRDESYTLATTLMTNVSDTRANLIKNI